MLATLMNALALQSGFELIHMKARVQSAIRIDAKVSENYVLEKAINALERGEVVIFGGGTGRPYFTTDTTATLVASELKADLILLGKNGVDGIYDADPRLHKAARRFDAITWDQILQLNLKVIDATAASMARDNNIELICFDINEKDALMRATTGAITHTKVTR
ncbi:unnamed protein product [Candidula unifasciata]|uniref:UMP kinase n=1 Tax=Candidula unifasciata TaxID=100452 RepID=A0A8S3ZP64_9EUPU|nr:unnamed protein product [Candidula unifasciata]